MLSTLLTFSRSVFVGFPWKLINYASSRCCPEVTHCASNDQRPPWALLLMIENGAPLFLVPAVSISCSASLFWLSRHEFTSDSTGSCWITKVHGAVAKLPTALATIRGLLGLSCWWLKMVHLSFFLQQMPPAAWPHSFACHFMSLHRIPLGVVENPKFMVLSRSCALSLVWSEASLGDFLQPKR